MDATRMTAPELWWASDSGPASAIEKDVPVLYIESSGQTNVVSGDNLASTTGVTVAGRSLAFTVLDGFSLAVTVPNNMRSSGTLVVTTPDGSASLDVFVLVPDGNWIQDANQQSTYNLRAAFLAGTGNTMSANFAPGRPVDWTDEGEDQNILGFGAPQLRYSLTLEGGSPYGVVLDNWTTALQMRLQSDNYEWSIDNATVDALPDPIKAALFEPDPSVISQLRGDTVTLHIDVTSAFDYDQSGDLDTIVGETRGGIRIARLPRPEDDATVFPEFVGPPIFFPNYRVHYLDAPEQAAMEEVYRFPFTDLPDQVDVGGGTIRYSGTEDFTFPLGDFQVDELPSEQYGSDVATFYLLVSLTNYVDQDPLGTIDGPTYSPGSTSDIFYETVAADYYPTVTVTYAPQRYRFWKALPVVTAIPPIPPLRYYPRDDAVGGSPRTDRSSTSRQSTARQGWTNTYR